MSSAEISAPWQLLSRIQTEGDTHPIEDVCGWAGNAAWVIDGATSVLQPLNLPAVTDPSWLAQQLSLELSGQALKATEDTTSATLLEGALTGIDVLAEALVGPERVRFPSAAVSVVTLLKTNEGRWELDVAALADCRVLVEDARGKITEVFASLPTEDSASIDPSHLAAPAQGVHGQEARLQAGRETRNTPGNLWVARREPEAAAHAYLARIADPAVVVLLSDGAWRAVELGLTDAAGVMHAAKNPARAARLLAELREHQELISEVADDATLLAVCINS